MRASTVTVTDEGIRDNQRRGCMSVREFFAWAGIGRTAVYAELKSGRLRVKKCGSRTLITLQDAQQMLDRLPSKFPS
jgi:hypothetical protein